MPSGDRGITAQGSDMKGRRGLGMSFLSWIITIGNWKHYLEYNYLTDKYN